MPQNEWDVGSDGGRMFGGERKSGTASMLSFATESNFRHVPSIPLQDSQERSERGREGRMASTNLTLVVTVCYGRENKSLSLSLSPSPSLRAAFILEGSPIN